MAGAAREKDLCTGHGDYPSRTNTSWSNNVFINGKGAHRMTDGWEIHCNPKNCHKGETSSGSSSVFINGLAAARIGDSIDCGSKIMTGSNNVIIGD